VNVRAGVGCGAEVVRLGCIAGGPGERAVDGAR